MCLLLSLCNNLPPNQVPETAAVISSSSPVIPGLTGLCGWFPLCSLTRLPSGGARGGAEAPSASRLVVCGGQARARGLCVCPGLPHGTAAGSQRERLRSTRQKQHPLLRAGLGSHIPEVGCEPLASAPMLAVTTPLPDAELLLGNTVLSRGLKQPPGASRQSGNLWRNMPFAWENARPPHFPALLGQSRYSHSRTGEL